MTTPEPARTASTVPIEAHLHHGQQAGIVSRTIAAGLDLAIVAVLLVTGYAGWAVGWFVLDPRRSSLPQPSQAFLALAYLVVAITYLSASWSLTGRSYGQHVLGLRVTHDGHQLRFVRAFVRAILCVGFPAGLLWVAFSRRGAALHDAILRTSVTYDWTLWHG